MYRSFRKQTDLQQNVTVRQAKR